MSAFSPIEWAAMLYGRFGNWGLIFIGVVLTVVVGVIWILGTDKYNKEHPTAPANNTLANPALLVFGTPLQGMDPSQTEVEEDISALSIWNIPVTVTAAKTLHAATVTAFRANSKCGEPPRSRESHESTNLRWENGTQAGTPQLDLAPGTTYVIGFIARYARTDFTPKFKKLHPLGNWYGVIISERARQQQQGQPKWEEFNLPFSDKLCVYHMYIEISSPDMDRSFRSPNYLVRIPPKGEGNTRFTVEENFHYIHGR